MPPLNDKIKFFFPSKNIALRDRGQLKRFLTKLLKDEGRMPGAINFIFCSDDFLLQMNREYLKHDYYTDIITFDLSESSTKISAEIYISIDRVRENAESGATTISNELHRVIFHGLLHLCGYMDKTKEQISEMRKKEDRYLLKYFQD